MFSSLLRITYDADALSTTWMLLAALLLVLVYGYIDHMRWKSWMAESNARLDRLNAAARERLTCLDCTKKLYCPCQRKEKHD